MQATGSTVPGTSDRECLESWARHRDADSLRALVERYLVFVHSSALRRTGDPAQAAEATRAVFLVLARRARRLRKKTVLAGWLFHVTAVACRKLTRRRFGKLRRLWHWLSRKPRPALPPDATLWTHLAPQMDRALERLRKKQWNAVLLCTFLNHDFASAAKVLRTSEWRVEKRFGRGMKKLAKRLGKRRAPVDAGALASACATEGCAATVPEGLSLDILQSMEASRGQRPSLKLARRTLNTLAWLRWRRRFVIGVPRVGVLIAILGGIAVYIDYQSGFSRLLTLYMELAVRSEAYTVRGLAAHANPWPTNEHTPTLKAANIRDASELYRTTNIWLAHLNFSREEWKAVQPKRIAPLAKFIDWSALQVASMLPSIRKCAGGDSKLAEALEFLNRPDFIPAESEPAELEFKSKIHFQFRSPRPCEFAENNLVHGRLYRRAKEWQKFPTIILLHGGGDSLGHRYGFPLKVPAIHRAGFNAATLVAPYHFQRRVRRIEAFDHLRVAEAFAQGVAEIRALIGWLLDQGCPAVALFGFSLGGWLAGLAATRDSRLQAIILALPGLRRDYRATRGECVLWTPMRKALEKQKAAREALDKTPMNLTLSQPIIPKESILLIQGRYDLLVEAEQTEELWQKWKQPEIWRLPHGHISWMGMPGLTGRVLHWLSPRLNHSATREKS